MNKVIEGETEVINREFDVEVLYDDKVYWAVGNYEHGEGFEDMVEIEDVDGGPSVEYNSDLYDGILDIVKEWITSI